MNAIRRGAIVCGVWLIMIAAIDANANSPIPDTIAQRVVGCTNCHGKEGRAAADGYYPRIAGKPAGYLYQQLKNFRQGRRQSPLMIYMTQHLPDSYLREIADYFAGLDLPYPAPQQAEVTPSVMARGKRLAMEGDASLHIPACRSCHGARLTGTAPFVPGLLGLPRDYINAQFGAWKNGVRHAAPPDCMEKIAARLSFDDISAVSAWLSSQPLPGKNKPDWNNHLQTPLPCGSLAQ